MSKVTVAIPNTGLVHKSIVTQVVELCADEDHSISVDLSSRVPADNNRNHMIKDFIERGDEYLLFMDSDNPPMKGVNPLELVDLDKDIVILPTPMWKGSYEKMRRGSQPIQWNCMVEVDLNGSVGWAEDPSPGGLKRIDAGGSGCLLVARRVLEEVKPAFMREWDEDGVVTHGSDFMFCRRSRQAGFEVWAHYGYPCCHFKERDLAEIYQFMKVRDIAQMNAVCDPDDRDYRGGMWVNGEEKDYVFTPKIIGLCEGKTVQVFGCGRGDVLCSLDEAGIECIGVDSSGSAVNFCKGRGLDAVIGDEPLPGYDVIVCTEVLERIGDDSGMIEDMLSKSDMLVYVVPNNSLPPAVEPEHKRVYTKDYAYAITPHFDEMVDYGTYLLVVADKSKEGVTSGQEIP